jgi:sodium/hydrogen exchanger 10/11
LGVGYLLGLFGRYLLRKVYTDHLSVLVIIFALPFFTQAIAEVYLSACGAVSVLVVGIMMGMERTAQSKEVNKLLVYIWQVTGIILDIIMCFTAALVTVIDAMPHLPMNQYTTILVSYLLYYVLRFVGFLLFSPIISRLSYGIDFKSVLVCVWGGIKGPYTLELVAQLVTEGLIKNLSTAQIMFVQIVGLYLLSVVINGSITRIMLNILGLTDISTARQINMSNCMRHIFTKRERTIAILKMDR